MRPLYRNKSQNLPLKSHNNSESQVLDYETKIDLLAGICDVPIEIM